MKGIKIEQQKLLQDLKLQLAENEEALQKIHNNNLKALRERGGSKFFAEFAALGQLNLKFADADKFSDKMSCFSQLKVTSEGYFHEFQTFMCRVLNLNAHHSEKEIQTLQAAFETTARQYYSSLVQMNLQLKELILNRFQKTSLFKTPNVSKDIDLLKENIALTKNKIKAFEDAMNEASLQLIKNNLYSDSTCQNENHKKLISINLKAAIDNLESEYSHAYDQAYGKTGFWRNFKNWSRKKERDLEIQFLKDVSNHPDANDAIRYEAMLLVHNKISESEVFSDKSQLKKILDNLTLPDFTGFKDEQNDLNRFLKAHKDIRLPTGLSCYYEKHKEQYSCDNLVKYS
ncbi:hypothetical protein E3983_12760 [Legionella israelensis]|uniref:Coiled-coil protein n=1 Tax=Legionella israelensis TaxID=454 RepID=A0AAX1EJ37_9GAMM|nr:hypothetical protein [Legionella israelensis]QBR85146.1 hypothetical protein E3983_12760 [Legionella israelensis]